jgi:hypothetical protein
MRHSSLVTLLVPLFVIGCGSSDEEKPPGAWEGTTPHFSAHGFMNGENVDIRITGDDAATGSEVYCGREYVAPRGTDGELDLTRARMSVADIVGNAIVGGEERSFELEIRNHSFGSDQLNLALTVVPRVDGVDPARGAAWLDWEWHGTDGEDIYEASAQDGSFEFKLLTGAPGEDGVVIPAGEGSVGGFVNARWSVNESLTVSFTVPCTVSDVEEE